MKTVILNGSIVNHGDLSWDVFRQFGELEVFDTADLADAELKRALGEADIVVGDGPDLGTGTVAACPKLKIICVTATGYDGVDCAQAAKRGIPVCNVPSYGTASVSQYAISLLLEICGNVAFYSQKVHEGQWFESWKHCAADRKLIELSGKTMGVIGFGNIGRAVGAVAKALGMNVLAYNRSQCEEGRAIAQYVSLPELYRRSDVISVHIPLSEATKHIISRESIAQMKDGVIIINNGRGALVDSAALSEALCTGKVYAAGLDVVEGEPNVRDNPLLKAPNCFITPHISWLPRESRQRILDVTVQNISCFLSGRPQNVVNKPE